MGLGVRRAGCRELRGGKWVHSCVRGRGGGVTAPMASVLLPSPPAWDTSGEQEAGVNLQQSEGYLIPKATQNLAEPAGFWLSCGEALCAVDH